MLCPSLEHITLNRGIRCDRIYQIASQCPSVGSTPALRTFDVLCLSLGHITLNRGAHCDHIETRRDVRSLHGSVLRIGGDDEGDCDEDDDDNGDNDNGGSNGERKFEDRCGQLHTSTAAMTTTTTTMLHLLQGTVCTTIGLHLRIPLRILSDKLTQVFDRYREFKVNDRTNGCPWNAIHDCPMPNSLAADIAVVE